MRDYVTKSGDMFDLIAYEQMGSGRFTSDLMAANLDKLNFFIFPADVHLNIPETETTISKNILPPWKR